MTKAVALTAPRSGVGEHQGGRQGGRRRKREARSNSTRVLPWREVKNRLAPIEVLSADQVETIHQASLKVLANVGIKVLGADARGFYRKVGADIDEGEMIVRFAPELVEELLAKAPSNFTIEARNPERSLEMGGIGYWMVYSAGFVSVPHRRISRRLATQGPTDWKSTAHVRLRDPYTALCNHRRRSCRSN